MRNYIEFIQRFNIFKQQKELGKTFSYGREGSTFVQDIDYSIPLSKVFEVEDDIKKLLALTNISEEDAQAKLPFEHIFIDATFTKEELAKLGIDFEFDSITGFLVRKGVMVSQSEDQPVGHDIAITISTLHKEYVEFHSINAKVEITDPKFSKYDIKHIRMDSLPLKSRKFITNFVLAFLNFLHNPEIEYIITERSQKNQERRIKQGKPILPTSTHIKVTGTLKQYLNKLHEDDSFSYSHRFWVRGHFRTLRNPRYNENIGKKIWLAPFVKGKGVLVEKIYHLEGESK